jgi:hypothetical protein
MIGWAGLVPVVRVGDAPDAPAIAISGGYSWISVRRAERNSFGGFFTSVQKPASRSVQIVFQADLHQGAAPFVFEGDRAGQSRLELFAGPNTRDEPAGSLFWLTRLWVLRREI